VSIESSVRLNKYISDSGYCSRREADKLIDSNRVKVNGRRPELGTRVYADDLVTVDGQEVLGSAPSKSDRVYIVYNKPIGITCTTERSVKGNIIDAIDHDQRIFPIGRLDKPSEGLILLTSDGDIVNKILRAENNHEKEYVVTVNRSLGSDFASKMSGGVPILGTMTKPCRVSVIGRTSFKITLTQGLNRQIRRMCEYLGYEVIQLSRVRIMNVALGKLKPGQWRNLSPQEVDQLNTAIDHSHSEPATRHGSPKKRRGQPPAKPGAASKRHGVKAGGKPGKSTSSTKARTDKPTSAKPGAKKTGAKKASAKKPGKMAKGQSTRGDSRKSERPAGKTTRTGRAGVKKSPSTRTSR